MAKVLTKKTVFATTTLDDEHGMMWLHVPDIHASIAVPIERVDEDLRMHDAIVTARLLVDEFGGVHEAYILDVVERGVVADPAARSM